MGYQQAFHAGKLFEARVDRWVLDACRENERTFTGLLDRLPGVYPQVALESLDRLARHGRIDRSLSDTLSTQAYTLEHQQLTGNSLLPLPHPLDFEWRFTRDSSTTLLQLGAELAPKASAILLLGTPGVAATALSFPIRQPVVFIGEDNIVTRRLIALNDATDQPLLIRLCHVAPSFRGAGVVILDPPWYMDFLRPMFAAAAAACQHSGNVVASIPPIGARPSAMDDRDAIFKFASRVGLEPLDIRPLGVRYDTPLFERNALRVSGISAPPQWRRGDVAIFQKVREPERPIPIGVARRPRWQEVSIGRMRLFIRRDQVSSSGSTGLIRLLDDDVLPSVSRRDPRRRQAHVWTSGNRIFATDNTHLVFEAAMAYHATDATVGVQRHLLTTPAESDAVKRVAQILSKLAATEAAEECGSTSLDVQEGSEGWTSDSTNCFSDSTKIPSGSGTLPPQ
jgi:hypothetical protein